MKALIVDDDPFALNLLAYQLAQLGVDDVQTREGAPAALAAVATDAGRTDILFVDLNMPGMDGVEFLRHLANQRYRGSLVLVSGESERVLQSVATLARAHRLHLLGTLTKPVSRERLAKLLEAASAAASTTINIGPTQRPYGPDELEAGISAGQLINHYQPQVELATGRLTGAEALVRWQHPRDGLISPERFVPVAEAAGLSNALVNAVLASVFQDALRWRAGGLHLRMAVNVTMDNLTSLDFPDRVVRAAGAAGVPASDLVLEITESQATRNRVALLDIATRLRLKQIGLAIDDFGTGFSSLAQLRDIPFDELKLDRGFVHGAAGNQALRAILQANLGMARELQLRTVAEGVEDRTDWDCLRELGCTTAQGYFIARPMPSSALPAWTVHWRERLRDLL